MFFPFLFVLAIIAARTQHTDAVRSPAVTAELLLLLSDADFQSMLTSLISNHGVVGGLLSTPRCTFSAPPPQFCFVFVHAFRCFDSRRTGDTCVGHVHRPSSYDHTELSFGPIR